MDPQHQQPRAGHRGHEREQLSSQEADGIDWMSNGHNPRRQESQSPSLLGQLTEEELRDIRIWSDGYRSTAQEERLLAVRWLTGTIFQPYNIDNDDELRELYHAECRRNFFMEPEYAEVFCCDCRRFLFEDERAHEICKRCKRDYDTHMLEQYCNELNKYFNKRNN